jgi:hypothetical protein
MTTEIKTAKWGMTLVSYREFDGEDMLIQTIELMDEIKKKNPLLKFKAGSNRIIRPNCDDGKRIEVKTSMQVYDAQDTTKPIGGIGFDSEDKYWVRSRLIQNEKYGQWNRTQYESKYSKHIKNIVKEAGKALKPIGYHEVVAETEGHIKRVFDQIARLNQAKIVNNLSLPFADLLPELLHMHNTGYIPTTPKVASAIAYAVGHQAEVEKHLNYNPRKCMIWVRPNSVVYAINNETKEVNSTAELPDDLRGKLFVLDVTDNNQFVEDIGIKHEGGVYWVLL